LQDLPLRQKVSSTSAVDLRLKLYESNTNAPSSTLIRMIPTKSDIVAATRVSIIDDVTSGVNYKSTDNHCVNSTCFSEGPFQPLFNATYRYRGNTSTAILTQLIPSTGRYHFVPLFANGTAGLPPPSSTLSGTDDHHLVERLALSDHRLRNEQSVAALLDPLYPESPSLSTAWVEEIAGRFFVMPSAEWANVTQEFTIRLGGTVASAVSGTIGVSELRMGVFNTSGSPASPASPSTASPSPSVAAVERLYVFSQSNWGFTTTELRVTCSKPPTRLTVDPPGAQSGGAPWAANVLTIRGKHSSAASISFVVEWDV
jgi:hypothetical protein